MFVILRVSSGSKETGIMAGAAIGATVALSAMFAGPACGASMNPARSLGPAIVSLHVNHLWIYLVAPVIGACVAVALDWLMKIPAPEPSKVKERLNHETRPGPVHWQFMPQSNG